MAQLLAWPLHGPQGQLHWPSPWHYGSPNVSLTCNFIENDATCNKNYRFLWAIKVEQKDINKSGKVPSLAIWLCKKNQKITKSSDVAGGAATAGAGAGAAGAGAGAIWPWAVGTITTWLWEIYLQNCVFMYVCMYVYICRSIYLYMCVCLCAYVHI